MKKLAIFSYVLIFTFILAYPAFADFANVGQQGEAYTRAEEMKDEMQKKMNNLVAFGAKVDQLKNLINNRLGPAEAAIFQTDYIDPMNTLLDDINTAWQAAR